MNKKKNLKNPCLILKSQYEKRENKRTSWLC